MNKTSNVAQHPAAAQSLKNVIAESDPISLDTELA